jgi:protein involved in polysaccharide export with SLBB domain
VKPDFYSPAKLRLRPALLALLLMLAAGLAFGQQSPSGVRGPDFRGQQPEIDPASDPIDPGGQPPGTVNGAAVGESQEELDNANRALDVASSSGHAEEADSLEQQVKDWEGRVKDLEGRLAEVNNEVQGEIQQMQPPGPEESIIVPGDNVEVYVAEDTSFNGVYQVRRGGYIILPAVGRIFIAGKTNSEAEEEIKRNLEATQLQHATVTVEKQEGSGIETGPVVYLSGAFNRPGVYHIPTGTKASVISVIISSGGVTPDADETRVKLMRMVNQKPVVEVENVEEILAGGYQLPSDLTVTDGDIINIPTGSTNVIYVTGCVKHEGTLPFKPGDRLTAYAAILKSGGFARFADKKKVYVLRSLPDGTKVKIPVNILAIMDGKAPDIPLEGNDIIVVPEKWFSF